MQVGDSRKRLHEVRGANGGPHGDVKVSILPKTAGHEHKSVAFVNGASPNDGASPNNGACSVVPT